MDYLWYYYVHDVDDPNRAAELALHAVAVLRGSPIAAQRAVVLALKALAFAGRWGDCWSLAASEIPEGSLEVIYQCARLSYFDGRREILDAYLPHLESILPHVPDETRPDLLYWVGMLNHRRGKILAAVKNLRTAVPLLQASGRERHTKKLKKADEIVATAAALEGEVVRIFDFSNCVWKAAAKRHEEKPSSSKKSGADQGRVGATLMSEL